MTRALMAVLSDISRKPPEGRVCTSAATMARASAAMRSLPPHHGGQQLPTHALLAADLDRQVAMTEVAAAVGLPYETWRRRFRARAGVSPYEFRSRHRLDTSADLLAHPSMSTREVAAALGHSDERRLIRRLRAETSLSPRQNRERASSGGSGTR